MNDRRRKELKRAEHKRRKRKKIQRMEREFYETLSRGMTGANAPAGVP